MNQPGYQLEVEPHPHRVRAMLAGIAVVDSKRGLILRETRHAPVLYFPKADVRMDLLEPTGYRTHCPFKGDATYWNLVVGERAVENAVWAYEDPIPEAARLADHVAFYRQYLDEWLEEGGAVALTPEAEPHGHGNPLVDWLMREAWQNGSIEELVAALGPRLREMGMAVSRLSLLVRTLHPQVMGTHHVWNQNDSVERRELTHATSREERFLSSPLIHIFEGRGGVRRRLDDPHAALDFPILKDLLAEGGTDYAAMPLHFSDGQIHALTLATGAPGGFRTDHLGYLHEVLPLIARLVEAHAMRRTARTLLDTYLGSSTGGRVLDGLIRRGDGEVIPAVIWLADLRGSTVLAERLPRDRYLDLLNDFFECTAGAAMDNGGEVLKFIGDAVLAIFPLNDRPSAAADALAAARDALARIDRYNQEHAEDGLELGAALALHRGDVSYGNVGVEGRLDFTVTGPAVHQAARLEVLSKTLDKPLIASAGVAELVGSQLASLGHHELRGFRAPMEVFTLRELA